MSDHLSWTILHHCPIFGVHYKASSGPHGADRLGGNMLTTCTVFGKIAGLESAENALRSNKQFTNTIQQDFTKGFKRKLDNLFDTPKSIPASMLIKELKTSMWRNLMVVRNEEKCNLCREDLVRISENFLQSHYNLVKNPFEPHNLEHMILTALLVLEPAQKRKESRGSHYREDYPTENEKYSTPIILTSKNISPIWDIVRRSAL